MKTQIYNENFEMMESNGKPMYPISNIIPDAVKLKYKITSCTNRDELIDIVNSESRIGPEPAWDIIGETNNYILLRYVNRRNEIIYMKIHKIIHENGLENFATDKLVDELLNRGYTITIKK